MSAQDDARPAVPCQGARMNDRELRDAFDEVLAAMQRMSKVLHQRVGDGPTPTPLPGDMSGEELPDPFESADAMPSAPQSGWQPTKPLIEMERPNADNDADDAAEDDDPSGGSGVREPRGPVAPLISGGAAADPAEAVEA